MLSFEKIDKNALEKILTYLKAYNYGACDFTAGGMFMWADYLAYEYHEDKGVLYIRSRDIEDKTQRVFPPPLGKNGATDGVKALLSGLKDGEKMILNPVPEILLPQITEALPEGYSADVRLLDNWADYVYDAESLAYLSGHRYNKKRNLVHQFKELYPDYSVERLLLSDMPEIIDFLDTWTAERQNGFDEFHAYENHKVREIIQDFEYYGFVGIIIRIDGKMAALTAGEIIGDTLFTHIERADTAYKGIYQMINAEFAKKAVTEYGVRFINREEDAGQESLRQAKTSYFPVKMLNKYSITVELSPPL